MVDLAAQVIQVLHGKTLSVAESCTGGGLGAILTAVPGSSGVFVGGIISYTNAIKSKFLSIPDDVLQEVGAVSAPVAEAMALGVISAMQTDIAVSITGLAGPGGDDFGNPVGTVYIGYCDQNRCVSRKFIFSGNRAQVRTQAIEQALQLILVQQID